MPKFNVGDPVAIDTKGKAPRYDGVKGVVDSPPHETKDPWHRGRTVTVYWIRIHPGLRPYFYEHELSKGPW